MPEPCHKRKSLRSENTLIKIMNNLVSVCLERIFDSLEPMLLLKNYECHELNVEYVWFRSSLNAFIPYIKHFW